MLYSPHDDTLVVYNILLAALGHFCIMTIRYLIAIVLLALGGILIGESILSSVNAIEIIIGALCLAVALFLFVRTPIKR